MSVNQEAEQEAALHESPERQLVQRIVASPHFAKSARLKEFLLFVFERALEGRREEITEQQIGVHVFGRPLDYNPSEDSIVRTSARLLRQKLDSYFETDGNTESLRLVIPKGGYIPSFVPAPRRPRPPQPAPEEPDLTNLAEPLPPALLPITIGAPKSRRLTILIAVVALLALTVGFLLHAALVRPTPPVTHPLWSRIFSKDFDTLFVAADTGLVLYENLMRHGVPIDSYISHSYAQNEPEPYGLPPGQLHSFAMRRYSGVVDLKLMALLMKLPELTPARFQFRYARDLQLEELRSATVILNGAAEANPWVELFQDQFNFVLAHERSGPHFLVTNRKPQPGEQSTYVSTYLPGMNNGIAFGHIVFMANLSGSGEALVIEGTGSAGTEAAIEFLLNDGQFLTALNRIRVRGRPLPHFEMLLKTAYIADSRAPGAQLVGIRSLR
jgi:hypothetical protein